MTTSRRLSLETDRAAWLRLRPRRARGTGRVVAWIALTIGWAAATAAVVPVAFEGYNETVRITMTFWQQ